MTTHLRETVRQDEAIRLPEHGTRVRHPRGAVRKRRQGLAARSGNGVEPKSPDPPADRARGAAARKTLVHRDNDRGRAAGPLLHMPCENETDRGETARSKSSQT